MPSPPPDPSAAESGARDLIGYGVDLSPEDGSARVVLDVDARHLNRNGSLHGGIVAMLLDSAAGFAVSRRLSAAGDAPVVTVTLTTQYLAPARVGRVVATGRCAGGGRRLLCSDAELHDVSGALLARASGVFKSIGGRT